MSGDPQENREPASIEEMAEIFDKGDWPVWPKDALIALAIAFDDIADVRPWLRLAGATMTKTPAELLEIVREHEREGGGSDGSGAREMIDGFTAWQKTVGKAEKLLTAAASRSLAAFAKLALEGAGE